MVSVHSFRGGTGKSNLSANVAAQLAKEGLRVGVIDADVQSPGIHVLFGLKGDDITSSLNDFLFDGVPIEDVAVDVTPPGLPGRVHLIPSSIQPGEITRVLRTGTTRSSWSRGCGSSSTPSSSTRSSLDTHPGLQEETLLSLVVADTLLVVLRPDQQDYEGTGVTVHVAKELEVPRIALVVNQTPTTFDPAVVRERVEQAYDCPVVAVLPHSEAMMALGSAGIFSLQHPDDPLTAEMVRVAEFVRRGAE